MLIFAEKNRESEVVNVTADHRIKENYGIIFADATDGNLTVYAPSLEIGKLYSVSKSDASGNTVTVQ